LSGAAVRERRARSVPRVDARYESVARTLGDDAWQAFRRVTPTVRARSYGGRRRDVARAVSESIRAIVILTYNPKS
jgi:ABC-type sulfate transport system permease component